MKKNEVTKMHQLEECQLRKGLRLKSKSGVEGTLKDVYYGERDAGCVIQWDNGHESWGFLNSLDIEVLSY